MKNWKRWLDVGLEIGNIGGKTRDCTPQEGKPGN